MSEGPLLARPPSRRTWNELLELPGIALLVLKRAGGAATLGVLLALGPAYGIGRVAIAGIEPLLAWSGVFARARFGAWVPSPVARIVGPLAAAALAALASALILALVQCAPLASFAGALAGRRASLGDAVAGFPRLLGLCAATTAPLVFLACCCVGIGLALGEGGAVVMAPFGAFMFVAWLPVAHVGFLTLGQVHAFVGPGTTRAAARAASGLGAGREWLIFHASLAPCLVLLVATPSILGRELLSPGAAYVLSRASLVVAALVFLVLRPALAAAVYAVAARAAREDAHNEATS